MRLFIALKSNKTEIMNGTATCVYFLGILVTAVGLAYYMAIQTYVLLLEMVIGGLSALFLLSETAVFAYVLIDFRSLELAG